MVFRYIESGACLKAADQYNPPELEQCALKQSDCTSGAIYKSSRELTELIDTQPDAPGVMCATSAWTEDLTIGRCSGASTSQFKCTGGSTGCSESGGFVQDSSCSVVRDNSGRTDMFGKKPFSLYPACNINGEDKCRWDLKGCDFNGYTVGSPVSALCTCDAVQTGACFHASTQSYFCAVSEDSCDAQSNFISATELHNPNGPDVECRLCRPLGIPRPNTVSDSSSSGNAFGSSGAVRAIGVSFLVGAVVALVVVSIVTGKRRKSTEIEESHESDFTIDDTDEEEEVIPPSGTMA